MAIATVNPATGELVQTFTPLTSQEIQNKLATAATAYQTYKNTPLQQRKEWLYEAADILENDAAEWARLMTLEMGKPIKSAIAEAQKCALACRFYGDHAPQFLADELVKSDAKTSYIRYQPLGAILAVMPWNFPFWQVFRFAAPTLMAGNVGLLKHASNVPQCALAIENILLSAGFPPGVFQTLLIGASQVEEVINDERVKAAALTGSESAGASLAAAAGKQIKKTVLELGGSDPFIVLESANLEEAVNTAVTARLLNNGQSCIAAKRFIVVEALAEEFQTKLVEKFAHLKIGDPQLTDTDIGPLATAGILQDLHQQVEEAKRVGAKVLIGGQPLQDTSGNFYPPTIIANIPVNEPIAREEFFGPVALLFIVHNLEQAIVLANSTSFGLGASAWTQNEQECSRLVNDIEAGAVFINGMVKSDPRLPFGGIKRSGYGRELGVQGIREFVNIKTVWIG